MTSLRKLDHLKAWQFKHWAFLTGSSPSGRKAELQEALTRSIQATTPNTGRRIVSVDMGIRNLAYCVVDMQPRSQTSNLAQPLRVTHWSRRDLLITDAFIPGSSAGKQPQQDEQELKSVKKTSKSKADPEAFSPPRLSKTAYSVVTDLLSYKPDEILIERQRFRSGSASAILEWTIRVNMLESMLWASLETLRATSPPMRFFPNVHAIPPRRVAEFWLSGYQMPLTVSPGIFDEGQKQQDPTVTEKPRKARSKIEKKEKVNLVKTWASETASNSEVHVIFEGQAAEVAEAFKMETSRGAKEIAGGKLDDLADCFLQAMAYVRWEENKRVIRTLLQKTGDGT